MPGVQNLGRGATGAFSSPFQAAQAAFPDVVNFTHPSMAEWHADDVKAAGNQRIYRP